MSSPAPSLSSLPSVRDGRPIASSRVGSKRSSVDREREDSDDDTGLGVFDDDEEGLSRRPFKRQDFGDPSDEEGGEGGEEREGDDKATSLPLTSDRRQGYHRPRSAADEDSGDGGDDSFLHLLTHFANLHVPSSSTKPEQCPVCSQSFPLSDFADHVYGCLHSLDEVEKKEQERLDEKMARQLMAREVRLLDESERHSHTRDTREKGTDCPHGAECHRTDHLHFTLRRHPEVPCPVCNVAFPPFEINAHINLCLNDTSTGGGTATATSERKETKGDGSGMEDEGGVKESQHEEEMGSSQWMGGGGEGGGDGAATSTSSAFSLLRGDSESKVRGGGREDDDDSHLPIARDSDDEDEAERKKPSFPSSFNPSAEGGLVRTSSTSSPSDLKLTVEQASAVASHIIARKSRFEVSGGGNGNDPSLLSLLETFKHLGFTQENLSRLKEQQHTTATGQEGTQRTQEERKE